VIDVKRAYAVGVWLSLSVLVLVACGPASDPEFTIKDQSQEYGERTQTAMPVSNPGDADLSMNLSAQRDYVHNIDLNLTGTQLNAQRVKDRIYQEYKVTNATVTKNCSVPVDVPSHRNLSYNVEFVEIYRNGVVQEGASGNGKQLGTYRLLEDLECQVVGVDAT